MSPTYTRFPVWGLPESSNRTKFPYMTACSPGHPRWEKYDSRIDCATYMDGVGGYRRSLSGLPSVAVPEPSRDRNRALVIDRLGKLSRAGTWVDLERCPSPHSA